MTDELLLTPREKDIAWKAACGDNTDLVPLSYPDVLLKAQLAKVRQYYESQGIYCGEAVLEEARKQERERMINKLEKYACDNDMDLAYNWLLIPPEDWQALKEKGL